MAAYGDNHRLLSYSELDWPSGENQIDYLLVCWIYSADIVYTPFDIVGIVD